MFEKGNCMKVTWLLLPLLGLAATQTYSVQMYQCEDETGQIQYTQTPSPNCVEVKPKPVQSISVPPSKKVQDSSPTEVDNRAETSIPPTRASEPIVATDTPALRASFRIDIDG